MQGYKNLDKSCFTCHYTYHDKCDHCNDYRCSTINRYDNVYLCNDCNEIDIDAENERQQEREFERIQRSIETDPSC